MAHPSGLTEERLSFALQRRRVRGRNDDASKGDPRAHRRDPSASLRAPPSRDRPRRSADGSVTTDVGCTADSSRIRPPTSTGTSWSRDSLGMHIDDKAWTFRPAPANMIRARPKVTPYAYHCQAATTRYASGEARSVRPSTASATLTSPRPRTASAVPASLSSRRTALAAAHLCPPGGAGASQPPPLPVPPPGAQPRPPRGARPGALPASRGAPSPSPGPSVPRQRGGQPARIPSAPSGRRGPPGPPGAPRPREASRRQVCPRRGPLGP